MCELELKYRIISIKEIKQFGEKGGYNDVQ